MSMKYLDAKCVCFRLLFYHIVFVCAIFAFILFDALKTGHSSEERRKEMDVACGHKMSFITAIRGNRNHLEKLEPPRRGKRS